MPSRLAFLACAALCAFSNPAFSAADTMVDGLDARLLAEEIHTILSRDALPPRSRIEYDTALASLRSVAAAERVAEQQLYASIASLLHTIDEDRHSHLIREARAQQRVQPFRPASQPVSGAYTTDGGKVLVIPMPPTSTLGSGNIVEAANALLDDVRRVPGAADACALVIDLSRQTGGNGWPGIVALADLITASNGAQQVNRDGSRQAMVPNETLTLMTTRLREDNRHLLARFRTRPFAVVVTKKTSSAGEMIAIVLKGEARARTFGTPTSGYTTINTTQALSSGDVLAFSIGRYALADGAPIQGPYQPDVAVAANTGHETLLAQASTWARSQSPACGAP